LYDTLGLFHLHKQAQLHVSAGSDRLATLEKSGGTAVLNTPQVSLLKIFSFDNCFTQICAQHAASEPFKNIIF
jgi:hypothetical protein